jgi:hypothetical protein
MTTESEQESIHEEIERIAISEFLETCPPNRVTHISDLGYRKRYSGGGYRDDMLSTPEIQLHCPNDSCNGVRFFRCVSGRDTHLTTEFEFTYVTYRCSNCQDHQKTYSLAAKLDAEKSGTGELYKFGELPTFGPVGPRKSPAHRLGELGGAEAGMNAIAHRKRRGSASQAPPASKKGTRTARNRRGGVVA